MRAMAATMVDSHAIQSLIDRDAIVDVVNRYATSIDRRQWDAFGSCFTDPFLYKFMYTGDWMKFTRDDIVSICSRVFAQYDATQHIATNHQIRLSGDEATCTSTLNATHYIAGAKGGPSQRQIGYYDYHLIRTADGWQIDRIELKTSWEDGNQDIFDSAFAKSGAPAALEAIAAR